MNVNKEFTKPEIIKRLKKLPHISKVKFAVYCAEQVLDIYEAKYKNNKPRLAIDAAKLFIKDPSEENKKKCQDAAYAAAYAAAAYAAAYAAYAADASAAYAAAYAAYAADASAAAARAKTDIKERVLKYLDELENPSKHKGVEWDGSNRPPVGTKCEATWLQPPDGGSMDWTTVIIKGRFEAEVWLATDIEDYILMEHAVDFRKPETPEQKKAREREETKCELMDDLWHAANQFASGVTGYLKDQCGATKQQYDDMAEKLMDGSIEVKVDEQDGE